jgi:hypothetical protein
MWRNSSRNNPKDSALQLINVVEVQVHTALTYKSTIFRDVTPCNQVEFLRSYKGSYCLHFRDRRILFAFLLDLLFEHKDSGSMFLRNGGEPHGAVCIPKYNIVLIYNNWSSQQTVTTPARHLGSSSTKYRHKHGLSWDTFQGFFTSRTSMSKQKTKLRKDRFLLNLLFINHPVIR